MMVPDADHVNTSICPGVSNTTYLVCMQHFPNYLRVPRISLKMAEQVLLLAGPVTQLDSPPYSTHAHQTDVTAKPNVNSNHNLSQLSTLFSCP